MRTIHIKGYDHESWLFKEIFKQFLKDDSLWHFVYWEDGWTHKAFIEGKNLLIRISEEKVEKRIKNYLNKTPEITYEIYDFPYPRGKYQLGIKRLSWEARHLDICLPMLHALSVARIKLGSGGKFTRYVNHYFHIASNLAGFNHADEMILLLEMAHSRTSVIKRWYENSVGQLGIYRSKLKDYEREKSK